MQEVGKIMYLKNLGQGVVLGFGNHLLQSEEFVSQLLAEENLVKWIQAGK